MTGDVRGPLPFWRTVRLLLRSARRRDTGRRNRQRILLQQRTRKNVRDRSGLGFVVAVLFMVILNGLAAGVFRAAVDAGAQIEAERKGKIVVDAWFLASPDQTRNYTREANRIAKDDGGRPEAIESKLRDEVRAHGTRDFISDHDASPGLTVLSSDGRLPAMLGFLVIVWWLVMLVFQGEGLELDLQRRRHPMWEWLFSHPVSPGAVFLAEMLSPIAANPIYWGGPLFAGIVFGMVYGPLLGVLSTILIGVPATVAAACLGKALEIGVVLRLPPRSRGAMVGLMSWLGYASMMSFFIGLFFLHRVIEALGAFLYLFTVLPWPWLGLLLGARANGSFSFLSGMVVCWAAAGLILAAAVWFSVWGAQQGLSGNFGRADTGPSPHRKGVTFGRQPLYRKEFLWFVRDRSAIVQTILIPLTVASVQLFNFRYFLLHAQSAWNYLGGAGIIFGTYFLWILGPKSLASEGAALWISLTWPKGLESLLKAKAWLWSLISTALVALVLLYAVFLFPASAWKILLVGAGWFVFSQSMSEKSVTLVTVTSESGETQKIHWGRRMAAQLGMLTFSIGVLTEQWHIAVMGIVYSYMTAAAMWENFRARLPYLYDPWSEVLPPPPTLMHAMISISILVEGGAIITGILVLTMGRDNIAVAQGISYALCALLVSLFIARFLSKRGVSYGEVWYWPAAVAAGVQPQPWWRHSTLGMSLAAGAAGGLILGLMARGYLLVLTHLPATAEMLRNGHEHLAQMPNLRISYAVTAVLFAPFAEEYLFRGLLFRALDREWGGWQAVVGSAAFFAVYHPALSWFPVFLLGLSNALLFKKTGRLAPAVILHMVYNAVVVM
jgi:membrane protease YdiL (CAAX protease family)